MATAASLREACRISPIRAVPVTIRRHPWRKSPAETTDTGTAAARPARRDPGSPRASLRPRHVPRRCATIGLGGVMGAVIAVPALGFVLAPTCETVDYYVDLGPAENFKDDRGEPLDARDLRERGPTDAARASTGASRSSATRAGSSRRSRTPACTSAAPCRRSAPRSRARATAASTTARAAAPPARRRARSTATRPRSRAATSSSARCYAVNDDLERQDSAEAARRARRRRALAPLPALPAA